MPSAVPAAIHDVVSTNEEELLQEWMRAQMATATRPVYLIGEHQLRDQSREFLAAFRDAVATGEVAQITSPAWTPVRELLASITRSRTEQGFTPSAIATFVFSFKQPLFERLRQHLAADPARLADAMWVATTLLDGLGLYTTEVFQTSREAIIARQQQDMLELSTPVVKLWNGVLALPMIGTLDSSRTQVVMESLLQRVVETGAEIAILDITGVPTVDTLVAQHLIKTVTAARLMGADCIISGVRPQIAQTIVHLGVELNVVSKANLADAFGYALRKMGKTVVARSSVKAMSAASAE